MRISIEHSVDHYRADLLDLPGMPPVGVGRTEGLAVACLFWRLVHEAPGPHGSGSWLDGIKREPIIVNGETWDWPQSYRS